MKKKVYVGIYIMKPRVILNIGRLEGLAEAGNRQFVDPSKYQDFLNKIVEELKEDLMPELSIAGMVEKMELTVAAADDVAVEKNEDVELIPGVADSSQKVRCSNPGCPDKDKKFLLFQMIRRNYGNFCSWPCMQEIYKKIDRKHVKSQKKMFKNVKKK